MRRNWFGSSGMMIIAMFRELASISSLERKCCAGSASSFFWKSATDPLNPAFLAIACISPSMRATSARRADEYSVPDNLVVVSL